MKRWVATIFAALGAGLTVAGCTAKAVPPKGAALGPGYGETVFELGVADTVSMGSATTQEYRISDTANVADGKLVKLFTWAAKTPKSLLLGDGKRVYVFARMERLFGAPGISHSGNNWCMNGSSFVPRGGVRYRVRQTGSAYGACSLSITDMASGKEAEGVELVLFPQPTGSENRQ